MGREVMRVPVDFDWPLEKTWSGYLMPNYVEDEDAWEPTEPPKGTGWQLWQTVSEGSPISPVFAEREGLVEWLCSPAYTWGASQPLTREQAEAFVDDGWAPSFVMIGGKWMTGEAAAAEFKKVAE